MSQTIELRNKVSKSQKEKCTRCGNNKFLCENSLCTRCDDVVWGKLIYK